jgi:hypothetical protein
MRHEMLDILDDALDGEFPDMEFAMFEYWDCEDFRLCHPELIKDPAPIDLNLDPASINGQFLMSYRGVPVFAASDDEVFSP